MDQWGGGYHIYIYIYMYVHMGVVLNSLFPKWPPSREKKKTSRNFRGTIAVHDSDNKLI